ncbi:MAG TPA: universal stress protein [Nitrososphaeraceae archaeon]|jgi:nucleotide-binding universal stress UspA family protein|nr:universal stress protein [Nitrososphaeraceae archaeon]
MYQKILVPVDGSEPSIFALEHAINLAKNCNLNMDGSSNNVSLLLLYVIPQIPTSISFLEGPMRSPKTGELTSLSDYIKEIYVLITSNSEKKLTSLKNKYENLGILVQTKVISDAKGSVVDNIIKYAEEEKVDLIVIGNIGLGGIDKSKTLGSVSRSLAEKATCPILIVHSK